MELYEHAGGVGRGWRSWEAAAGGGAWWCSLKGRVLNEHFRQRAYSTHLTFWHPPLVIAGACLVLCPIRRGVLFGTDGIINWTVLCSCQADDNKTGIY